MIKMTGRTVLVAGRTVQVVGTWSDIGARSASPAEGPGTIVLDHAGSGETRLPFQHSLPGAASTRNGLAAAVADPEHLRLASTRPPASAARADTITCSTWTGSHNDRRTGGVPACSPGQ